MILLINNFFLLTITLNITTITGYSLFKKYLNFCRKIKQIRVVLGEIIISWQLLINNPVQLQYDAIHHHYKVQDELQSIDFNFIGQYFYFSIEFKQ